MQILRRNGFFGSNLLDPNCPAIKNKQMKPTCYIRGRTLFLGALLLTGKLHSQGSIYISNLEANSLGGIPIASNAWAAQSFQTGVNPGGYSLEGIQLRLLPASGAPTALGISLFGNAPLTKPGSLIATLAGNPQPTDGGVFSFTSPGLPLSPNTKYWIVMTSQSALADGAFTATRVSFFDYTATGNWSMDRFFKTSADGLTWTDSNVGFNLAFAVTATAIPEPSAVAVLTLSALFLAAGRIRKRTRL